MQETSVKMVDRIVAIFRVLVESGAEGLPLTEIAVRTDLRKTTVHRLLTALVKVGFAFQDLGTRRYRLGSAAAALGRSAIEQSVAGAAQPILARLAQSTGDTVFASTREGAAAICVARAVGSFPIRTLTLDVGDRRPLGVGAGSLALLAYLSDADIQDALKRNRSWLQDYQGFSPTEILERVEQTRRDGFALNEGRIVPGMNAIGVPVLDGDGKVLAALSLAAIKDRMSAERIAELVPALQAEARALADMLAPRSVAAA